MAEQLDIEMLQGDDFEWEITVLEKATGLPLDLTNFTARGMGRRKYKDPEATWEFTCTVDPDQVANKGGLFVEVPHDIVEAITPEKEYFYDIEIVNTNTGKVKKIYRGKCTVPFEITKPGATP